VSAQSQKAAEVLPGYSPPLLVESGTGPAEIDPLGRAVYSIRGQLIDGYDIDPSNGGVVDIGGAPFNGAPPAGMMVCMLMSPDGQFAYITASDGLYTFSVDSFGALHSVGSPIPLQIAGGALFIPVVSRHTHEQHPRGDCAFSY
jgi:hypothetical protein